MSDVKRIYVEKRTAYATEANEIKHNLIEQLGLEIKTLRVINRYDVQGISDDILNKNDNLTENDFKKLDFDLKTYDSDGFYKTADDCYITVETVTSKNLIFNFFIYYKTIFINNSF